MSTNIGGSGGGYGRPRPYGGYGGGSQFNQNYLGGSYSTNYGKRRRRSAQFHQNFQPGSQSHHFNCQGGGSCNIPSMQNIWGGQVHNSGSNFNQNYQGGSSSTNFGKRRKRSPQFNQNYHGGSSSTNIGGSGGGYGRPSPYGGYGGGSQFNQNYFGGSYSTNYGKRRRRSAQFNQVFEEGAHFMNCEGNKCGPATTWSGEAIVPAVPFVPAVPAVPAVLAVPVVEVAPTLEAWVEAQPAEVMPAEPEIAPETVTTAEESLTKGCSCNSSPRSGRQFYQYFQGKPVTNFMTPAAAPVQSPNAGRQGTLLCTYPGGKVTCQCLCNPFTIINPPSPYQYFGSNKFFNSWPFNTYFPQWSSLTTTPLKNKRSAQFHQNFQPGSQSQHFNCQGGGSCNVPSMQNIWGGQVHNSGSNFNQNYQGGSSSTNFGKRRKRSDDMIKEIVTDGAMTEDIPEKLGATAEEVPVIMDNLADMKCLCPAQKVMMPFMHPMVNPEEIRQPGTIMCTYPDQRRTCECICNPFTIINLNRNRVPAHPYMPEPTFPVQISPFHPNPYPITSWHHPQGRSAQFNQNFLSGSQSQHFNCQFGGCGNIGSMQQIHGGQVHNTGNSFDQNYNPGSGSTNYGKRRKRSPQFNPNYGIKIASTNIAIGGYGGGKYGRPRPYGGSSTNYGGKRQKRSAQFFQNFAPGAAMMNCADGNCDVPKPSIWPVLIPGLFGGFQLTPTAPTAPETPIVPAPAAPTAPAIVPVPAATPAVDPKPSIWPVLIPGLFGGFQLTPTAPETPIVPSPAAPTAPAIVPVPAATPAVVPMVVPDEVSAPAEVPATATATALAEVLH
jgi:hypothetical protein